MQFTKKTSQEKIKSTSKLLVKVLLSVFVIFFIIAILNKVELPSPNKKIEKIISNENFKTVK